MPRVSVGHTGAGICIVLSMAFRDMHPGLVRRGLFHGSESGKRENDRGAERDMHEQGRRWN
jgi:hypothetical protein